MYMKYTRQLDFYETPNYDYLRQLFASVMTRNDWSFDWVFDWTSRSQARCVLSVSQLLMGWLGSRVVSVLDSGAEGPCSNRSRDAVG